MQNDYIPSNNIFRIHRYRQIYTQFRFYITYQHFSSPLASLCTHIKLVNQQFVLWQLIKINDKIKQYGLRVIANSNCYKILTILTSNYYTNRISNSYFYSFRHVDYHLHSVTFIEILLYYHRSKLELSPVIQQSTKNKKTSL